MGATGVAPAGLAGERLPGDASFLAGVPVPLALGVGGVRHGSFPGCQHRKLGMKSWPAASLSRNPMPTWIRHRFHLHATSVFDQEKLAC